MSRFLILLAVALCLAASEPASAQKTGGTPYTYYHIEHPVPTPIRPPWPPDPPRPVRPPWWPSWRPWPYPVPVPYPVAGGPTIVQNYYTAPPDAGLAGGTPSSAVLPPPKSTQAVLAMLVPTTQTDIWVDGEKLPYSSATTRVYTTPDLEPGHTYEYTVRARWVQRGENVTHEQKVVIRPGQTTQVDFTKYAPKY